MYRVLCVDDEQKLAAQAAESFTSWKSDNPYKTIEAVVETDFDAALRRLKYERFDFVCMDLHGARDPDPQKADGKAVQEGRKLLEALRQMRFVPVIFYTGYAEKIAELKSPVVQIVKKGDKDVESLRAGAKSLFETGLPKLVQHIDEELRSYVWDTVDKHWNKFGAEADADELSYLLARRIAARFNREGIKELLGHKHASARGIEYYIYPPVNGKIKTGFVFEFDGGKSFGLVITPGCDFEQDKAERVLLVGATPLVADPRLIEWKKTGWHPDRGKSPGGAAEKAYDKLTKILTNRSGDRHRFLPGTFFLPDLILDGQAFQHVPLADLEKMKLVCSLDSPYKEELVIHFSKYYGRLGIPDLDTPVVFERLRR